MTKKDPYRDSVQNYAMELGGETSTHTMIEVRGGWILFLSEGEIIRQTHGYYDMYRYLIENYRDLKERLWKLSEARKLMEGQIEITISEEYLNERIEKAKARISDLKEKTAFGEKKLKIYETKLAKIRKRNE